MSEYWDFGKPPAPPITDMSDILPHTFTCNARLVPGATCNCGLVYIQRRVLAWLVKECERVGWDGRSHAMEKFLEGVELVRKEARDTPHDHPHDHPYATDPPDPHRFFYCDRCNHHKLMHGGVDTPWLMTAVGIGPCLETGCTCRDFV